MSYSAHIAEDIRLSILQILAGQAEYTLPESAMRKTLEIEYGHALATEQLQAEIAWLDGVRLLTALPVGKTYILSLTGRGLDISCGRGWVPGVARPLPRG